MNSVNEAQQVFENIIAETGTAGDFDTQSKGLVELAILKRKQGQYELAQACLRRATKIVSGTENDALETQILSELAQIEIERNNPQSALQLLNQISLKSTHIAILEAETLLSLRQMQDCMKLCHQLLPNLLESQDYFQLTSVKMILARTHQELRQFDKAIDLYNAALSYAERQQDDFAVARLQCNLATLLIHQNEISSAETLLHNAESVQDKLNDKVGLVVTRQNLRYLRKLKAQFA
jgi:tetratricopeptide (TPR) repeat protein